MNDKYLKLSIKPKMKNAKISANHEIKLNDWILGHGVTKIELSMPAIERPKLKIECYLDEVDIEEVIVESEIFPLNESNK
ncbi:hypothetical protein D3I38_11275 [Enterococcus faecium]|uniref:hypothetical protein n=1 Tax=Enterococcus faecium TaxID=1352 RepID=UPI0015610F13|nr:hypothetical protein [Enterococcus faecium]EGP5427393.1 hypothetical protein [Enterococcus faecium]EGP5528012.1 hypothetical protein [Enterococcus faecium]EGP5687045.1 hypothetical protein [Enterococcus faecium]EME8085767.1 hypothetical protein [Enterococcus faecium]NRE53644.1 hypothetical protein [Enterococcus faecium]